MWRLTLRGGKENAMPRYEVLCEKCQELFELIMTISERETAKPTCPTCKGTNVAPQFSGFMAQRGRRVDDAILKLMPISAQLVGESATEWQTIEKCGRFGERTHGTAERMSAKALYPKFAGSSPRLPR
jgi:putative FmdB family regulatory protein